MMEREEGCLRRVLFLLLEGEAGFVLLRAQSMLRNRKPEDQPILMDSWCPPIAVPLFLLATTKGSHPNPGHLETSTAPCSLCSM